MCLWTVYPWTPSIKSECVLQRRQQTHCYYFSGNTCLGWTWVLVLIARFYLEDEFVWAKPALAPVLLFLITDLRLLAQPRPRLRLEGANETHPRQKLQKAGHILTHLCVPYVTVHVCGSALVCPVRRDTALEGWALHAPRSRGFRVCHMLCLGF